MIIRLWESRLILGDLYHISSGRPTGSSSASAGTTLASTPYGIPSDGYNSRLGPRAYRYGIYAVKL